MADAAPDRRDGEEGVDENSGHANGQYRRLLVTGRSRSGTTLVTRLLDAQPGMHVANDILQTPFDAARNLANRSFASHLTPLQREALVEGIAVELDADERWGHEEVERFRQAVNVEPISTLDTVYEAATRAMHLRSTDTDVVGVWIGHKRNSVGDVLPALLRDTDVAVVYVLRDVRDVVHSMQGFCAKNGVPFRPKTIVNGWVRETRMLDTLSRHPCLHVLRFEDFVREPARACERLATFLGVPVEHDAPMSDASGNAWVSNSTFEDVSTSFDPSVLQRWRATPSDAVGYAQTRATRLLAGHGYEGSSATSVRVRAIATIDNAKFWLRRGRR
ncbi:MAG: hypothetical protein ACI81R_003590 [Bradymonadia bacterium]|jgi:hypothetical protein